MSRTKIKSSFLQTSSSLFQIISGTFVDAAQRAKTRRLLHALDDSMLKDIGISRCDINRIAKG
ncbi:MAG: DUF1127 domain-containing protein [Aestuariivirga sp.]